MAGDVIVKQGDPSDSMYIIEDGVCEVSAKVKDSLTGEYAHRCDNRMQSSHHQSSMQAVAGCHSAHRHHPVADCNGPCPVQDATNAGSRGTLWRDGVVASRWRERNAPRSHRDSLRDHNGRVPVSFA